MTHIINLNNPVLISNEGQFMWSGKDKFNIDVPNGVYFIRLNLENGIYWTK